MGPIVICIAALLLSLTGGTFLLLKTQKENLSIFYRIISWVVISLSLLMLLCCGIRFIVGGVYRNNHYTKEMMFRGHRSGMGEGWVDKDFFRRKMHRRGEEWKNNDNKEKTEREDSVLIK